MNDKQLIEIIILPAVVAVGFFLVLFLIGKIFFMLLYHEWFNLLTTGSTTFAAYRFTSIMYEESALPNGKKRLMKQ